MSSSQTFKTTKTKLFLIIATLCLHGLISTNPSAGAEGSSSSSTSSPLTAKCSTAIEQLTNCLGFATGSEKTPKKQCCDSVSGMKEKQPECLCFFIQQAHNGNEQVKSLGIKEANLLQLPSACQLTNASISNCPKLLGISPTSPAAAIFKDNGTTAAAPGSPSSSSTPLTTDNGGKNSSGKLENGGLRTFFMVFMSTIFFALPFISFH